MNENDIQSHIYITAERNDKSEIWITVWIVLIHNKNDIIYKIILINYRKINQNLKKYYLISVIHVKRDAH